MVSTFPAVSIVNLLSCVLVLVPLSPASFQSWNIGVFMFPIWVAVECFIFGVNTILWRDNVRDIAPVWCDITSHFGIGSNSGIPACSLIITRRLYLVTKSRGIGKRRERIELMIDIFLACLPLFTMSIYYVGQSHRYKIYEEMGCLSSLYPSILGYILIYAIPICLPLVSLICYSPRIIWAFYKHRREMEEHLASDSVIDRSNYIRLLILGCVDMFVTLPLTSINFIQEVLSEDSVFWPGFSVVHADFSTIPTTTKEQWEKLSLWVEFLIHFNEWVNPIWAVLFFGIFGLTSEARGRYRRAFWRVAKPFGYKPKPNPELSEVMFGTVSAVNRDTYGSKFTSGISSSGTTSSVTENAQTKAFDVAVKVEEVRRDDCSTHCDGLSFRTSHSDLKQGDLEKVAVQLVESSSRSVVTDA